MAKKIIRDRLINGRPHVRIGVLVEELGWSREAIINWLSVPRKFTAGAILRWQWVGRQRWFEWQSVLEAKAAMLQQGRFRPRR